MDQQTASVRPSVFKRRWFQAPGVLLLLLMISGGVYWWLQSGRVTATALFEVAHSVPSFSGHNGDGALNEYEFETLKRTQIALIQSNFVITAALRDPKIGSLPIIQRQADPVEWLQQKLSVNYPKDSRILAISLTGDESEKKELAAIVDSVAHAYRNEVLDRDRQERLISRDMLSRNLENLNSQIKRKLDEYLDIARETGHVGLPNGESQALNDKLKRIDRLDDEMMRFEDQLATDVKDTPDKAKLIRERLAALQKSRDKLYASITRYPDDSADLETRKRDLDCLQAIASDMTTRLTWLDIDANGPDRIRQVQEAMISPQSLLSRLPATHEPVANSR